MELQWIVFVLSICVFCCHGDYTCLCNYNVEIPVYTSPDTASAVVGYMYEFDCKNLVSESDPEWPAIEFEHQVSFYYSYFIWYQKLHFNLKKERNRIHINNHQNI